jgi:phosphoribosylformylglycinamidine synthase subunit PurL
MAQLTNRELNYLKEKLQRVPNRVELDIIGSEWSEHCSYKSSKTYLRLLPTKGKRVIVGPGQDAGVLDVGHGYVITVHIESHNHPSAVEPYGGSATGVGGVVRDIISMGTRPIAILNALRFAPISRGPKKYQAKSKWLFKSVVRGIADYGNCIGIPTVGGEIEFDPSFENYCLVDVASIGLGKRDQLIANKIDINDIIILAGGSTGRDGIDGASFASKTLKEENRSAVQIPDPFLEKLLLEATIESVEQGCLKAIKDLGGGGLSCCLSETSDNFKKGLDIELTKVHFKHQNMSPTELMVSESQERMLYITDESKIEKLATIFDKYGITYAIIGRVKEHQNVVIRYDGKVVAELPSNLFAHAPNIDREVKRPAYLDRLKRKSLESPETCQNLETILFCMLSNPTIANKRWVYHQYDHEVGLRTLIKPGCGDASVMKLDNGNFISFKLDGNSKHCYLDPYWGMLGCLSEACRNVVCTGAEPIGVIDHLQFGSPEDPEIFWTFVQTVNAMIEFCKFMDIPVVGGKVSFYNETLKGTIKPSPVIGSLGLIEKETWITQSALESGDSIFIIGPTGDEMGGSEYYEYYHNVIGGIVPQLDFKADKSNANAILQLIRSNLVDCVHDCSKGGLAVAVCEMAVQGKIGFTINLDSIPSSCSRVDNLMFSESQSRYIFGTREPKEVRELLSNIQGIVFAQIGNTSNKRNDVKFIYKEKQKVIDTTIKKLEKSFNILEKIME